MTDLRDKIIEAMAASVHNGQRARATFGTRLKPWDEHYAPQYKESMRREAAFALDALTTGPLFEEMAREAARELASPGEMLLAKRTKAKDALRAALGAREA